MKNYAIVLAAGKGTRMKVDTPKCAFPILNKPMIRYIVEAIQDSHLDETLLVVGHKKEVIEEMFDHEVQFVTQKELLGTGHAVKMALPFLDDEEGNTFITCGDMPLLNKDIIESIILFHKKKNNDITVVSTRVAPKNSYGKIIRDKNNQFIKITEDKDCSEKEKEIWEVNTGVYCVKTYVLKSILNEINVPSNHECYLTDIVEIGVKNHLQVEALCLEPSITFTGVNDLYALSIVETHLKNEINKKHLLNGVHILSPETVLITSDVEIEPGVTIQPNTILSGKTKIEKNCVIGPNTEIHNAYIEESCSIIHSKIKDSRIGKRTTVGPFAHIRDNTILKEDIRVGNFVEIKNSEIGARTKISHLTYIGDTTCGENVNWGCGCVTVNYDGKNKNRTIVGDHCFIGCNTNLIAPIEVGDYAFIAAGSTITEDIPSEAFSIARAKQITKEDYAKNFAYTKKKGEGE